MKKTVILLVLLVLTIPFSSAAASVPIKELFQPKQVETPSGESSGTTTYFYAGSKLIASKNGEIKYHQQDRLGSDINSKTLPFGQEIYSENRFSFTGKELDDELYYFGARYYNPNLGKFTSTDPIKDNLPYAYVSNNPMNLVDPDGKNPAAAALFLVPEPTGITKIAGVILFVGSAIIAGYAAHKIVENNKPNTYEPSRRSMSGYNPVDPVTGFTTTPYDGPPILPQYENTLDSSLIGEISSLENTFPQVTTFEGELDHTIDRAKTDSDTRRLEQEFFTFYHWTTPKNAKIILSEQTIRVNSKGIAYITPDPMNFEEAQQRLFLGGIGEDKTKSIRLEFTVNREGFDFLFLRSDPSLSKGYELAIRSNIKAIPSEGVITPITPSGF